MRILVADDHFIVREGLKYAIADCPDYNVVGEAENGEDVLKKTEELLPDLLVMDILMPGKNGLEVAIEVKQRYPEILIIIFSQINEIKKVHKALQIGVNAFLVKNSVRNDLLLAIQEVKEGRLYLSPELLEYSEVLTRFQNENNRRQPWSKSNNENKKVEPGEYIRELQDYLTRMETVSPNVLPENNKILLQLNYLLQKEKIFTNEKLTLSKTATLLKIDPRLLSEIINKELKLSFPQLLNLYRVKEAMLLLAEDRERKSIDIAFETGFGTRSQYNLVFKNITTVSPAEYRKIIT